MCTFYRLQLLLQVSNYLEFFPRFFCEIILSTDFANVYYYTGELFPTNLRSQAIGFQSTVARTFCACAPFLSGLANYWQPLPMVIIGIPIVISGALLLLLPSTHKKELPGTIHHALELHERTE